MSKPCVRMTPEQLLQQARTALDEWHKASDGDSADAEYTAACFMEHALTDLVKALT